jgi:hypothetical protein
VRLRDDTHPTRRTSPYSLRSDVQFRNRSAFQHALGFVVVVVSAVCAERVGDRAAIDADDALLYARLFLVVVVVSVLWLLKRATASPTFVHAARYIAGNALDNAILFGKLILPSSSLCRPSSSTSRNKPKRTDQTKQTNNNNNNNKKKKKKKRTASVANASGDGAERGVRRAAGARRRREPRRARRAPVRVLPPCDGRTRMSGRVPLSVVFLCVSFF